MSADRPNGKPHGGHASGQNGNGSNGKLNGATAGRRPRRKGRGEVVVIGGAGFVGSVLIPKLLERDYDVTVLDAFLFGTASIEHADRRRLTLVHGDIRSVESVVRGCRNAAAIVHLGGLVGDPSCAVDHDLTLDINLRATATIAEVARGLGVPRLVFASSCAVYGASDGMLDEESPLAPVSMYAHTKADSETLLMAMADEAFSPTALRFGTFYGLSPRPRFDLVVNLLAAKAVREGSISIFGGTQWRPFLHVEDGTDAIIACLEAPIEVVHRQAFNVGSDEQNHTLAQVAEMIRTLVPGVRVDYEEAASAEANYHVSFAKIRRELAFIPRQTLVHGILEIKAAVETDAVGDYREVRYSNHKTLTDGSTADLLGQRAVAVAAAAATS
jgi:nucleoside-diphosphate-sugar epimerase